MVIYFCYKSQSKKDSTIVNYNSSVVITRKMAFYDSVVEWSFLVGMTLEMFD